VSGIDRAVLAAVAQADTDRRPVVRFGDINDGHVTRHGAAHAGTPPVGLVDLDLATVDDPADHGDMAEPHVRVGLECQNAAQFRDAAAGIDASREAPPLPGVAHQVDARIAAGEWHAGDTATGHLVAVDRP